MGIKTIKQQIAIIQENIMEHKKRLGAVKHPENIEKEKAIISLLYTELDKLKQGQEIEIIG